MGVICIFCNKEFSSYSSRSNHVKKFHNHTVVKSGTTGVVVDVVKSGIQKNQQIQKNRICKFCNKVLCDRFYKIKHEKKCTLKNNQDSDDIKELIKENKELRKLIEEALIIKPKELAKINNQLNNNNCTINNNTIINNINHVPLGLENLPLVLTENEQLMILNQRAHSLRELIKLVHISDKYKQFKNVYITNLQNSIAYKYDENSNSFIAVNKSELLDDIMDCRMMDIESFYNNMKDKLDEETVKIIKRFIDRMNNNKDTLKGIKKEEIKLLLYNNRDLTIPKKTLEI